MKGGVTVNERIRMIRDHFNMTQEVFSKAIGLGQSTLGMIEVGKRDVLERHIKTICSVFNVNEEWFRTGNGEMFVETRDSFLAGIASQYGLDEFDQVLLESYLALPGDQRKVIKDFIQEVAGAFESKEEIVAAERSIDEEVESYRKELEAELKGEVKSSVLQDTGEANKEAN